MTPIRIQRRRAKGWRLPSNTVCVTRPGKWGNPFRVGGWFKLESHGQVVPQHFQTGWRESNHPKAGYTQICDKAMAVGWFERCITTDPRDFAELRGKNLACWCKLNERCHADVLLRHANLERE